MAKALGVFLLPIIISVLLVSARAASVEDFYNGKTIQFVVGGTAGGGYDTYTRLIARHFPQYVPGKPSTVVQNMTGAAMLIAANYTYNSAPRDGTVIGEYAIAGGNCGARAIIATPDGRLFFSAHDAGAIGEVIPRQ